MSGLWDRLTGSAMKNYEKWNKYKIGGITWINNRKFHPHRTYFVNYVLNNVSSVIEIGPGEMIEYQSIVEKNKEIDYAIVDVSELFITNCKRKFPDVKIYKIPLEELDKDKVSKIYDVVYVASVLEHSKSVKLAIKKLMSIAKRFHFVMFKWSYDGGLKSTYRHKKKYWSSSFNINKLFNEIKKWGSIDICKVAMQDGRIIDFDEFSKGRKGKCRTGDYLMIGGETCANSDSNN